jgi:RNA polymerase sigma factor (sigma-70 family)
VTGEYHGRLIALSEMTFSSAGGSPVRDPGPLDPETTIELLSRAKAGDLAARERLVARCLPPLRRWARGRLPRYARAMLDTDDLVQETVLSALHRLEHFEARGEGALQAYLRQALANRIKDVIRSQNRRPRQTSLPDSAAARGASPLDEAIGHENTARYEEAMQRLRDDDREAIVARIELRYSYEEVAVALGKPSADAARMAVARAVYRLAHEINDAR